MGLVKLKSSKTNNRKEKFSNNSKDISKKEEEQAKSILEWTTFFVNVIIMQCYILTYTTFTTLLMPFSWTKSVELFNRFSGDHLNQLEQQIEAEKLEISSRDNNNEKSQSYETEEWKMSKLQIAEASKKSYLNIPIKHAATIQALEKVSIFTNPFATIFRNIFQVSKNDLFQSRRTFARLTQKDGIVNNFLIEILDWYENHSFPAVIMLCTVGMFICVFITFILSLIGPATSFLLSSVIFFGRPVRSMLLVTFAIIVFILLVILWIFLWPVALLLAFGSILNVPLWYYRITFFHFKELFCEVERGGYIRNPMLLPYARTIGEIFNTVFSWLAFIIRLIGAGPSFERQVGIKLEKVELKNERVILQKICKLLGGIYDILWEYIIVAGLIYVQLYILCYAIMLKILSIVNPVSYFTRLKNGTLVTLPEIKIKSTKIMAKTEFNIKWHVPHTIFVKPEIIQSFLQYLTLDNWVTSLMGWVNEISLYDRKIYRVNNTFIKPVIKQIENILFIELDMSLIDQ